ncbi:FecR family protein [Pedobacter sp. SYSU D00535]|uniref:FecR family protein n=1 Tax=Pedobacter sp. SYSU D00535 TaxID=2810308 RepID=UPI001A963237|nr:FecR domain-containing protein [Pedobacter sp. SYSU D00535]
MDNELLVKYLLKETTAEEEQRVQNWLESDLENQKEFARMELIWSHSKNLASKSTVDENAAWDRFKKRLPQEQPQIVPIKALTVKSIWLKVAAVLVLISGAWFMYQYLNVQSDSLIAAQSVVTETLPDGSEVTLNKHSEISYAFSRSRKQRLVTLEKGEVFFKVSPDKEKPFIIKMDKLSVKVVGTSFNIKHTKNQTEVIVETGVVEVSSSQQQVRLRKGEKVVFRDQETMEVEKNTDQLYNYYRTKEFVADNTPLWRVVEVLNEAYQTEIVIENPEIRNLTITTTFKNEPIENILQVIKDTFDISVERRDERFILR